MNNNQEVLKTCSKLSTGLSMSYLWILHRERPGSLAVKCGWCCTGQRLELEAVLNPASAFSPLLFYVPVSSDYSTSNGLIHSVTFLQLPGNAKLAFCCPAANPGTAIGSEREKQSQELSEQTCRH